MEITLTAFRHVLPPSPVSKEESTRIAEEFVRQLKTGDEFILRREPDNCADPRAIAAYYEYRKVAYVVSSQVDFVHPILNNNGEVSVTLSHTDGHVTAFVNLPQVPEQSIANDSQSDIFTNIQPAFGGDVYYTQSDEQRLFRMIFPRLQSWKPSEGDMDRLARMADIAVSRMNRSLSGNYPRMVHDLKMMFVNLLRTAAEEGWDTIHREKIRTYANEFQEGIGDFIRSKGHAVIYESMLQEMREVAAGENNLLQKYIKYYFNGNISGAEESAVQSERERLKQWLYSLPNSIGHYYLQNDIKVFADKVAYSKLTEREVTEILSVIIVLKHLSDVDGVPANAPKETVSTGKQGKQPSALFRKDGNRTIEDTDRRKKEKERLCGYLSAHHLGSRMLNSQKDDKLNKVIVCFCNMWKQRGWVSTEVGAPALRRFLVEDCLIGLSVTDRSFEGVIRDMIGNPYDADTFGEVKECFTNKD